MFSKIELNKRFLLALDAGHLEHCFELLELIDKEKLLDNSKVEDEDDEAEVVQKIKSKVEKEGIEEEAEEEEGESDDESSDDEDKVEEKVDRKSVGGWKRDLQSFMEDSI
jgi:hypothetical protein